MALKSYTMWLDLDDKEDRAIVNYLRPKIKRRKVSGELREAMLVYLDYLAGNLGAASTKPVPRRELPASDAEIAPTVNEAARTFIKRRS